jgi:acyl-CoA thioesterase YciA
MELLATHTVKTSDLGCHGNLFGGVLLSWVDLGAVGLAMRLCSEPRMLTLSIEDCFFLKTVQEGELVSVYATPSQLGRTSLAVSIEARSLNLHTQEEWVVFRTSMRFVCVDPIGRPSPIRDSARLRITALIDQQRISLGSVRGPRPSLVCAAVLANAEGLDGAGI